MGLFQWLIDHVAPIFLITSPITSYSDQIYAIHRTRTSAGFSLDIPLIMLFASILKIFYWLSARFDPSLLIQAMIMIILQSLLLHVALTHRPSPTDIHHRPFTPRTQTTYTRRPYNFWRWPTPRPYWITLLYFTILLTLLQLLFAPFPPYTSLQGSVALFVEALLPIPQLLANQRRRACKGFRLSVLANWLVGDAFKMVFFFAKGADEVPWAFKICGVFQAACDVGLGVQYAVFGEGSEGRSVEDQISTRPPIWWKGEGVGEDLELMNARGREDM